MAVLLVIGSPLQEFGDTQVARNQIDQPGDFSLLIGSQSRRAGRADFGIDDDLECVGIDGGAIRPATAVAEQVQGRGSIAKTGLGSCWFYLGFLGNFVTFGIKGTGGDAGVTKLGLFALVVAENLRPTGLPEEELSIAVSTAAWDKFAVILGALYKHDGVLPISDRVGEPRN
jgi:hypothetical protein